jgi:hypothetical protein
VTPGLHSQPTPLQALALITNPRLNEFIRMFLQDLCNKFVGFFNFTFDAFMYVSLSLKIYSKNVMNGIVGIVVGPFN